MDASKDMIHDIQDTYHGNLAVELRGNFLEGTSKRRFKTRKALLQEHKERVVPELREEDLEEIFIRGSGPGGQATNKTSNNVSLIHKPTGIRVTCHKTRSQATNRQSARKMLVEKLDQLYNPGITKEDIRTLKIRERKRQGAKKARKKRKRNNEGADMVTYDRLSPETDSRVHHIPTYKCS